MIEHVSIHVSDYEKAKALYSAALKPLGYKLNMEYGTAAGFMEGGHTSFWIVEQKKVIPTHIAFRAKNKNAVHDFHTAALEAGAKDNGKPGPRPDYSPDYYAAFFLDEDGNNVEAVWYDPDKAEK